MEDGVAYECGIDIHSDFTFEDGDLKLVEYSENLVQAVNNRLNTNLDELNLFYEEYGSILSNFFGWKATEETLDFIEAEISTVLASDSRISDFEIETEYTQMGLVKITLELYTTEGSTVETSFVLTEDGLAEIDIEEDEVIEA